MSTTLKLPVRSITIGVGKHKKRSQMCEMFTDDGRIFPVEFEVLRGCMDDTALGMGFLCDSENQFTNEAGDWVQLLGERSMVPLCPIRPTDSTDLQELRNKIWHETHEDAKVKQYELAANKDRLNKITTLIAIPCITILLIYAIQTFGG